LNAENNYPVHVHILGLEGIREFDLIKIQQ